MLRTLLATMLVACSHGSSAVPTTVSATNPSATNPSATTATAPAAVKTRPSGWYLPSGRYRADGLTLTHDELRVELRGDWTVEVREEGTRHVVELALDGGTETWEVVDRLQLHLCATERLEPRPGVAIEAGTPLYLRGATDTELTVASSPALPDGTFRIPRSAAAVEGCPSTPVVPVARTSEARTFAGLRVPTGTPVVVEQHGPFETHSWAFEAGPNRWWLVPATEAAAEVGASPEGGAELDQEPEEPGLDKQTIRTVIRTKSAEYRGCYQWRLESAPDLTGRVLMRFVIGPTGSVDVVQTEDGPGSFDLLMETCVARHLARLRFPPPRGGGVVIVTYPFVFLQREAGAAVEAGTD